MKTYTLFIIFLIQFSMFAQKDTVLSFSKVIKYKNNLYVKKKSKCGQDILKINEKLKTERKEMPHILRNSKNPYTMKWNMIDSILFTISDNSCSNSRVFFLFKYMPIEKYFRYKLNIDTVKINEAVANGTFFDDYKEMIEKSRKENKILTITSIAYLNERINRHKRPKKADEIQFDFYFDKKEQYNQTLYTFDTYLYILEDSILSLGKYKLGYSTKIDFFVGGQRESDWRETKRFYFPVNSEFHAVRQDTNIYLFTTREVYQHKKDTIIKIGRIIQKNSIKINKINNYYILDTDNDNQILLFPPLYYIKEKESAFKISTVNKNSKVYKQVQKAKL